MNKRLIDLVAEATTNILDTSHVVIDDEPTMTKPSNITSTYTIKGEGGYWVYLTVSEYPGSDILTRRFEVTGGAMDESMAKELARLLKELGIDG